MIVLARAKVIFLLVMLNNYGTTQIIIRPELGITSSRLTYNKEIDQDCKFYSEEYDHNKPTIYITIAKEISNRLYVEMATGYLWGETGGNNKFRCFTDYEPRGNKYEFISVNPKVVYRLLDKVEIGLGVYGNINTLSKRKDRNFGHYAEYDIKEYTALTHYGLTTSLGYVHGQWVFNGGFHYGLSEVVFEDQLNWIMFKIGYEIEVNK